MDSRLAHASPSPPRADAAPSPPARPAMHHNGHAPRPVAHAPIDDDARDLALIAAHRAGDPAALGELLTRYQDRLFAVCLRMIGDADQAGDLLQDAMVRIIAGLSGFDGRSKLSTWMIRIAMNACLTELRRRKLRRHASLDSPAHGSDNPLTIAASLADPAERNPSRRVIDNDDRRRLYRALAGIDSEQRAILILRDAQGLDYRRIAEVLDIPEGTVKSRLFRARSALRQEMERLESKGAADE